MPHANGVGNLGASIMTRHIDSVAAAGTPTVPDGCGGQTELGERGEALPRPRREGARFPERGVDLLYRGEARGHDGD